MSIQKKVDQDWKDAMKARDMKKSVLSLIRNELKNKAIQTRESGVSGTDLDDSLALEVLSKMAKQRKESISIYQQSDRNDLKEKEEYELEVLETYLPQKMPDDEVARVVAKIIVEAGASSMRDMGKVMGLAIQSTKGRADGKFVQDIVKKQLSEL